MGVTEISADDAFILYATHGLSPTQIKSLGYVFNNQQFAEKMKSHQDISRAGATKKFAGGLADHSEQTVKGHTATHLLHQALRDMLGINLHQTGSNITSERVRFDFNFDRNLTPEELKKIEDTVNQKIKENLPVHFQIIPLQEAKKVGAIGLFNEKYSEKVGLFRRGLFKRTLRRSACCVYI
jgi:alanyl-tRNA synthetase